MSRSCDLRSVGYRILRENSAAGPVDKIQFAFNLYQPLTTWHMCSMSVLIDQDGDGIADQEIAGVAGGPLEGVNKVFTTLLLDAAKARAIRLNYETLFAAGDLNAPLDYTPSVIVESTLAPFNHSSLVVLEAPMAPLSLATDGRLHIKVAAQSETGDTFEGDDFLGDGLGSWQTLSPNLDDQPFYNMEEIVDVPQSGATISATQGAGTGPMVIYYPFNDVQAEDSEQIIQ